MSPHQARSRASDLSLCGLVVLVFLSLLAWTPKAHAQNNRILLLAESNTYQPRKNLTVYVFFFRMPEQFSFFRLWERSLRGNQDFRVRKTERLSIVQEYGRDGGGFPSEYYNILYRLELEPRRNQGTLRYGPLRLQAMTSNTLSFSPAGVSSSPVIQSDVQILTKERRQGQPLEVRYRFRCPLQRCDYERIEMNDLLLHLRQKAQLLGTNGLWASQTNIAPDVQTHRDASPPHVEIRYTYTFRPLRSGTLQVPQLRVPVPVIQTMDARPISTRITRWLQTNHKIPPQNAQRYVQMRQAVQTRLSLQETTTPHLRFEAAPLAGCPGQWQLRSRLVTPEKSNAIYWEVALQGDGFLLMALPAFRSMLSEALKQNKLSQSLQLAHVIWRAPEQDLNKQVEIAYYFELPTSRPRLPALSMQFLDDKNKAYTRTQPAIEANARVTPLSESFAASANERRIYIYYDRAPTLQQSEQTDIWTYQLPEGIPVAALLSQRWQLKGGLQMKAERKVKNITRRTQTRGMFGMMTQVITQGVPLDVEVGQVEAQQLDDPLARVFPTLFWGPQRISVREETGSGLTLSTSTERKRYFVGEAIEYKAVLRCPANECTTKEAGFYKRIFQKNLKLPSFDRFTGWQKLDDFTRQDLPDGSATFTYRVRFKTSQVGQLTLQGASLRLPEQVLSSLREEHQICFFRGGRAEERLTSAMMRDHMNLKGQRECATGTQELETTPIQLSVETLPAEARDIKLIGTFRLQANLAQLTYPTKQATIVDKPFYLLLDISGDGDLKTAQQILQDQLSELTRKLRKQDVTAYIEVPSDEQKKERVRIQLQLIAEQPTTLRIPSITLRYYHREEGVLTAQTLPFAIRIEPRNGTSGVITPRKAAPTPSPQKTTLLQDNELRPNYVLSGEEVLTDQTFSPWDWWSLSLLGLSPLLLLLFAGWQRQQQKRAANPERLLQQKALSKARQALKQAVDEKAWERAALQALQGYLSDRFNLRQKHMTSDEVKDILNRAWPAHKDQDTAKQLMSHFGTLEDALYGGGKGLQAKELIDKIDQNLKEFDRACPR
ncbi:MAG: BatD family protein [Myxococcales bacterium]|nr:BatD family protein [Myxococcales bacterium]